MTLSPKLLMAAVVALSTPVSALAQTWQATGVASAPQMRSQPRAPALNLDRPSTTYRAMSMTSPQSHTAPLKMTKIEPGDLPEVDVQAKDAWSDDEGFRVGPTKLAFKRRF